MPAESEPPSTAMASVTSSNVDAGPPPLPSAPLSSCTNVDYGAQDVALPGQGFSGATSIVFNGDGSTTQCASASAIGVCVEGNAVSSERIGNKYGNWGAALSIELTTRQDVPFDAAALGATHLRVVFDDVEGRAVGLSIAQVDDPNIEAPARNFHNTAFNLNGQQTSTVKMSGQVTVAFADFRLPRYSGLFAPSTADPLDGLVLDPSKLYAINVGVYNVPLDTQQAYSFCVRSVEWLDAGGEALLVPEHN